MAKPPSMCAEVPQMLNDLFAEPVHREVLDNGLTVVGKETPGTGLATAQYWVRTGSIHEGECLGCGVSHFLEHMLFKGTEKRPGGEVSRVVQEAGGYINAYTSFDRTVYYIEGPSESLPLFLDVLTDMVFNALLPEATFASERDVILREIDMGLDDPDRTVAHAVFRNAFRTHPYRYPVIGNKALFSGLAHKDLVEYYESRYAPGNATLVIAGDVDWDACMDGVRPLCEAVAQRRCSPVSICAEPEQLAGRRQDMQADVSICRGSVCFRVPGLSHPDSPGLDLLASILGHGNSSLLWQRLREEQQVVSYVDASCWNPGEAGLFWISYICEPGKYEAAEQAVLALCAEVARDGISTQMLEKALRNAVVSEVNSRKTVAGQASRLGVSEVVIGDLGYSRHYFEKLHKLTVEGMSALAARYFREDRLTRVSLNSKREAPARVAGKAREFADFEELRLDNGARIIWQQCSGLPKLHLRTAFLGGPLYEGPQQRGLTALLATLLTRDTESRDAAAVATAIEEVGGTFNDFSGNNTFGLAVEVLRDDTQTALDILADALLRPAFDEGTFQRERAAQIDHIREDEDEVLHFGRRRLRQRFFRGMPFETGSLGMIEDLEKADRDAVRAYWERLVAPENVVLAVAGDFDPDTLLPAVSEILMRMPERPFSCVEGDFSGPVDPGEFTEHQPREQAIVFHAYPDAGITQEDFHTGEVLEEIFSEMSGRLFHRVREERGLAYFVSAYRVTGLRNGMFSLYAGTHAGAAEEVGGIFTEELERIREGGLEAEEIERAKARLRAQKRMSMQTPSSRAMQAALNALYGLDLNDWKRYDGHLDAVTQKRVRQFAADYLEPGKALKYTVLPEA